MIVMMIMMMIMIMIMMMIMNDDFDDDFNDDYDDERSQIERQTSPFNACSAFDGRFIYDFENDYL